MEISEITYVLERELFHRPPDPIIPLMGYLGRYIVYLNHAEPYLSDPFNDYADLVGETDEESLFADLRNIIQVLVTSTGGDLKLLLYRKDYPCNGDEWYPKVACYDSEAYAKDDCDWEDSRDYIVFRVKTEDYFYYLGLHDYKEDILVYCYNRQLLESYLANALCGIDISIPDKNPIHIRFGDALRINYGHGGHMMLPCYYIDEKRFAFGSHICDVSSFYQEWVGSENILKLVKHDVPRFKFWGRYCSTVTEMYFCEEGSNYDFQLDVDFRGDQTCFAQFLNKLLRCEDFENYLDYNEVFTAGFDDPYSYDEVIKE